MSKSEVLSRETKPETPPIEIENISESLKKKKVWVVWSWKKRNGKWQKPPVMGCKSNDPESWMTFDQAISHYLLDKVDGIGVALTDGICGIDLDDCIKNGQLSHLAKDIIATMDCYWEHSPSGTGIKLLFLGEKPDGPNKNPAETVEVYDTGRYFTVTGHQASGDIVDRQNPLEKIYAKYVKLPDSPALKAMLRIKPNNSENDGSKRLLTICCRAVEHNLTDEEALRQFRIYETQYPFPKKWSDSEILTRVRQAESRDDCIRGSAKPVVLLDCNRIPQAIEETVSALAECDGIYQKENSLVRIIDNKVSLLSLAATLELLTKAATFEKNTKTGIVPCRPDREFRQAVLQREHFPGIPVIKRVVSHPVVLPDGSIITKPGYNEQTGLYLNLDGSFPHLVLSPQDAVDRLSDTYCNFPLRSKSDLAGLLAITLTMVARNLIEGSTPMFSVDGNRSGCGKGYTTDIAISIAEGRLPSRYSGGTNNQEELRKMLLASAIAGKPCILFDNVRGRFGGPVLEGVLTTNSISDRILGVSRIVDVEANFTWVLTANNVRYSDDMPRRVVPIFLDTKLEKPGERDPSVFKHPNLKQHVHKHRNELAWAALSILAGYIKAGKPNQKLPGFGGFEEWSDLVRSALVWAGLPDCLEHRAELFEATNQTSPATKKLIESWSFDQPVTSKRILELLETEPAKHLCLRKLLDAKPESQTETEFLGKLLRSSRGMSYGGRRLDHNGAGKPKWFVAKI